MLKQAIEQRFDQIIQFQTTNQVVKSLDETIDYCILQKVSILLSKGDIDAVISYLQAALPLASDHKIPGTLTGILIQEDRFEEAINILKPILEKHKTESNLYYNLGLCLRHLGKYDEAIQVLKKGLELKPDCSLTNLLYSKLCFAQGFYEEAFNSFWYRFNLDPKFKNKIKKLNKPFWDSSSNVRLLVFNEEGNGDLINFIRYVKLVKDCYNCYIILETKSNFKDLMRSIKEIDEIVEEDKPCEYDMIVSVNSLPSYFDPSLEEIPIYDQYLEPANIEYPSELKLNSDKRKIGLCWAGDHWNPNDKYRSCHLKYFRSIFELEDTEIYSLQLGSMIRSWTTRKCVDSLATAAATEHIVNVDLLEEAEDLEFIDLTNQLKDYNLTAYLLNQLDAVITVDTSIAHLAGALGVPTYLALSYNYEWRWNKSWYPSMKIFKQDKPNDWASVVDKIKGELL